MKNHCVSCILLIATQIECKRRNTMALPISILKNILNFKCMHVNKCEIIETTVQVYGENQVQKILKVKARPFKRYQRLCPICKKKCCLNGIKQKEESHWRAPNLNGMPVYIYYQPHRILCPEHHLFVFGSKNSKRNSLYVEYPYFCCYNISWWWWKIFKFSSSYP